MIRNPISICEIPTWIFFIICFFWPVLITSQPELQIKAGINRSSLDFEYKNYRWGFHAGGAARLNLSTVFYLQPELLFSVKGSRVHEDFFISPYLGFEYVFEYLTIPCFVGIRLGKNASLHFGPEINFLLGGTFQITDHPGRLKNFPTTTDIGVTGGLIVHPLNRLEIGLRYEYGFTDIPNITLVDNQGLSFGIVPGGNNRNLQLSVGYILRARHDE